MSCVKGIGSIHSKVTELITTKKHVKTFVGQYKVVKVALTKHHAMKAYWGSGGIAPLIR
jgi:hypothetical protein